MRPQKWQLQVGLEGWISLPRENWAGVGNDELKKGEDLTGTWVGWEKKVGAEASRLDGDGGGFECQTWKCVL